MQNIFLAYKKSGAKKYSVKLKIAYIHGRFGPHIMHGRLAKSVGAEFFMVDQHKKWNDGQHSKFFLIYAWIYNALAFKESSKYDIFLVSGSHFSPFIMKFLRLKKRQKIVAHLGDETMYFLYSGYYGKFMTFVLKMLLNQYDALLCEGQMAADLAKLNGITKPRIYTTYLGVPKERQYKLLKINPQLDQNNLITISSGPKGWREYYKGLDLMVACYSKAFEINNSLTFTIVGNWDIEVQNRLKSNLSDACVKSINFVGQTSEIDKYLSNSTIYFHTSRGDAFPTVVLEAMAAGLIPIVSEWTGSKEVIETIDKSLIVPLEKELIISKLIEICAFNIEKRRELSSKMKSVSQNYTEEFAINHYQSTFIKISKDLNILLPFQ